MAVQVEQLITEHLDLWTQAQTAKSTSGRGSNNKIELTGIKKLRELILELAVRGKLVPQDPNDEPASELLKRIAAEKEALVKAGKLKKQKPLPPITDEEKPFELPIGWSFSKLQNLVLILGDGLHGTPVYDSNGEYYFVNGNNLNNGVVIIKPETKKLNETEFQKFKKELNERTVFVSINGTIGNVAFYNAEPIVLGKSACYFNLAEEISKNFIKLVIQSPYFHRYASENVTGSTIKNLGLAAINNMPIALPPAVEQDRIVAKVGELMALCDQLEQQSYQQLEAHNQLVDALLATLTQSQNADELASNWQRLAAYFDTLFTTEYSIDALKQTILQLAVMGKLVKQDPNDEPASELLKRIAAEKDALVKAGKIKKQKPLPPISDDEKPFELPDGWEWCRLENLTQLITKGSSPKWQGVSYTDNPDDVLFVTSENVGAFQLLLDKKKYVEFKFNEVEPRSILEKGDFLMNIVGASIGRTAVYCQDDLANINQAVCLLRSFPEQILSNYLLMFFNSPICVSYMYDKQVDNARANLSMGNIAKFVIPIPPKSEQERIFSKFNQLTKLCDELAKQLLVAKQTQAVIAEALVEQVVN